MILEFAGELNAECKKYIDHKHKIGRLIKIIIIFFCASIPVCLISFLVSKWLLFFLIFTAAITVVDGFIYDKSFSDYPKRIIIDENCCEVYLEYSNRIIWNKDIINITDMGTWYKFKINFTFNSVLICQKNLIIKGSIEEFEEFFKDKIVRKTENQK